MDELASDREKASFKPVLMVGALLAAAVFGAAVTVHPAPRAPQQPNRPAAGVAVIGTPPAPAVHGRSLHNLEHVRRSPSKAVLDSDWV
jgi:hypothetical protein